MTNKDDGGNTDENITEKAKVLTRPGHFRMLATTITLKELLHG